MSDPDLNLLAALDVLLAEASVTEAARRMGLSASAMSRTLARLRSATGDPLLVRAGRRLVPTPHALALRDRVQALASDARTLLSPQSGALDRVFSIRANEGFIDRFAAPLVAAVMAGAPRARLRFTPKPRKEPAPLRDGEIDLEIGVAGAAAPELRMQLLFRDGFVGAVRRGHPLLACPVTPEAFTAFPHVAASRKGAFSGPVDSALAALGLRREVVAVVPGFPDALRIASRSDLVALVPRSCLAGNAADAAGFSLPVHTPEIAIVALWHPRMDADPAHRWLRGTVVTVCRAGRV